MPSNPIESLKFPKKRLEVVIPGFNDIWFQNRKYDIKWRKYGKLHPKVHIGLFRQSGRFAREIATSTPNTGRFIWHVPRLARGTYTVAVATVDFAAYDFSDVFQIGYPTFRAIAAGERISFAVMSDGSVWTWGGTVEPKPKPEPIDGLTNIVSIATGWYLGGGGYALALDTDGTVWAWGSNHFGSLGDGTTVSRSEPAQVMNLTGVTKISAGREALALKDDGTVWAWGSAVWNGGARTIPVKVEGLPEITDITAGGRHSLALDSDGKVWGWGANFDGELGEGTPSGTGLGTNTPVEVVGLPEVKGIAAGASHSMALATDGNVWAWGSNTYGQLGNGEWFFDAPFPTPMQVLNLSDIEAIVACGHHNYAIKENNDLWAWGPWLNDQFGVVPELLTLEPIILQSRVESVAGGERHTLFLQKYLPIGGTRPLTRLLACGSNLRGELGDGTTTSRLYPVLVRFGKKGESEPATQTLSNMLPT